MRGLLLLAVLLGCVAGIEKFESAADAVMPRGCAFSSFRFCCPSPSLSVPKIPAGALDTDAVCQVDMFVAWQASLGSNGA